MKNNLIVEKQVFDCKNAFKELFSRNSLESEKKTYHNLRKISESEDKNQDKDNGVNE